MKPELLVFVFLALIACLGCSSTGGVSRRVKMEPEPFANRLTYSLPGMERVIVQTAEFRTVGDTPLMMDIYYPPSMEADARLPMVVFVIGFADSVAIPLVGSPLKDFGQYVSWGRLTAASGLIGITYQTQQPDDLEALVEYIRDNAASLGLDADRVGIWACSGNVPTAISFIMQDDREYIKFAVLYYGFMLTSDNKLSKQVNAQCASLGCYSTELEDVKDIRNDLPLFIVRAGLDSYAHLNESIDHFVTVAAQGDAVFELVDYAEGIHGFDVRDFWTTSPHEQSGEIVRQTLEFMKSNCGIK